MDTTHDWRARALGPFPTGAFLLLWSGRLVSQLGDRVYAVALAWWVLQRTGSAAAMGLVMGLSLLPEIALGLFAGPLVDRWDRRAVLVWADLVRGVLVLGVAALEARGALSVAGVAAAGVGISLASAFFNPASQAIVPQVVPEPGLQRANSLHQLASGLSLVAGPLLGAAAVGAVGFAGVFAGNALSYLASGLLEAGLSPSRRPAGARAGSLLQELRAGVAFLWTRRPLLAVIAVVGVTHFFWGAVLVSLPVLARTLAGGVASLGLLQTMIGAGVAAGAAVNGAARRREPDRRTLFAYVALFGVVSLAVAALSGLAVTAVPAYAVAMLLYGAAVAGASVLWQSLLQRETPAGLTGRVFSVSSLVGEATVPLAFACSGAALERHAVSAVLLVAGLALVAVGGALRWAWRRPGSGACLEA